MNNSASPAPLREQFRYLLLPDGSPKMHAEAQGPQGTAHWQLCELCAPA